jgi:enamine deaminase RidA (YjgF/YER057c/UK114 family)
VLFFSRFRQKENAAGVVPATVNFNFHVRPILSDRCFKGHGPDEKQRQAVQSLFNPDILIEIEAIAVVPN